MHSITEEEFDLAEDPHAAVEDLPNWQREAVTLARGIQKQEGKRYMALPDKFDVHEWAMMDRFSMTLRDAQMRNDFHGGIRGAGAFPREYRGSASRAHLSDGRKCLSIETEAH